MKARAVLLVVTFILIMTLSVDCVHSAAGKPSSPAASTAPSLTSLDDPQELERFLDA